MRDQAARDETTLDIAVGLAVLVVVGAAGTAALVAIDLTVGLSDRGADRGVWSVIVIALVAAVLRLARPGVPSSQPATATQTDDQTPRHGFRGPDRP